MKRCLFAALLIANVATANEIQIGPVSIKPDTESLSSMDWANAGQGITFAIRMDVLKLGGGSEMFTIRPYPFGLSLEYAGLVEAMVDGFSLRHNFRYTHLLPRTFGDGPTLYIGDRLDTSALYIQKVGVIRVDANNEHVIEAATGQPYLDNQAVEITARTFRGWESGGLDAGDIRLIVRGANRKFEFKRGPKQTEEMLAVIDDDGLTVKGTNHSAKLQYLEARIGALEAALNQANNGGTP